MGEEEFDDGRAVIPSLRKKTNLLPAEGKQEIIQVMMNFSLSPQMRIQAKLSSVIGKKSSIFASLKDL